MSEGLQKALKTAMVTGSTAEAATLHDGSLTSHDKEILLTITTGELEALKKLEMDARLKKGMGKLEDVMKEGVWVGGIW